MRHSTKQVVTAPGPSLNQERDRGYVTGEGIQGDTETPSHIYYVMYRVSQKKCSHVSEAITPPKIALETKVG